MRLIMLGTGMAMVTKCYNTCFVLADHTGSFMVDGGGGNGIFRQADAAGVKNLVLYHSEDVFLEERKRHSRAGGRQYCSGGLYVPDDLEVIELN